MKIMPFLLETLARQMFNKNSDIVANADLENAARQYQYCTSARSGHAGDAWKKNPISFHLCNLFVLRCRSYLSSTVKWICMGRRVTCSEHFDRRSVWEVYCFSCRSSACSRMWDVWWDHETIHNQASVSHNGLLHNTRYLEGGACEIFLRHYHL